MSEAPAQSELRRDDAALTASVLSVGSELLLGDLTDTNATWVSDRLRSLGVEVVHHLSVRDDLDDMVEGLRWLARRAAVIVVGGGLGPTSDDRTREAVALAAEVELEHRDELAETISARFASFGRRMPEQNLRQARVPAGARALDPVGTAPGFALTMSTSNGEHGRSATRVYALPGVPWELRELWDRDVAPEVQALAGRSAALTRVVHVVGMGESDVAELVEPLEAGWGGGAELSFLARSHGIEVRLTVRGEDADAARATSQPLVDEVVAALGGAVAGLDEESLEDVVLRLLGDRGETVAPAESATAGAIAARLGQVPGASHGLVGGVVVYSAASKRELLGIDAHTLETEGPVSEAATAELARGARERFASDWGLGVTGVAGPGTQNELPVGSCFWALAHPDGEVEVHGRRVPGDRTQIIARLGTAALELLRRRLV